MKVTKENFKEEVLESSVPVLVDFYADWCGPCKMMAPAVEKLADEANGVYKVAKLNIDDDTEIAIQYGVMSIPTFIVFKDGKETAKSIGVTDIEALRKMI